MRIEVSIEVNCKTCKGKGFLAKTAIMWGSKQIVEYVCPDCHGKKTVFEKQTLDEVEFKRMLNIKD